MSALTFCRGKEDCLINKNWKKMCDRNLLIGEMIIYDELERVVTFCLERISLRDFSFLEEDRRGWKILADSQRYDRDQLCNYTRLWHTNQSCLIFNRDHLPF